MSFNSYQLKYIALFSMIIDHVTIIFQNYLSREIYYILRGVGRLSFPIYCFLLVEGFFHTRNQSHYLIRLIIFAIISELPFDLALNHGYLHLYTKNYLSILQWDHQNVFFTLALGFACMMLLKAMETHFNLRNLALFLIFLGILSADYLRFDYGAAGVLTILLFYFYRKNQNQPYRSFPLLFSYLPLMFLSISSPVQLACLLSLPLIMHYNGEKGSGVKYLFYLAYPAHLLIFITIFLLIP